MLANKVAIVTGASLGIGRAIALGLAKEGVHVVLNYNRSAAAVEQVFSDIIKRGGKAVAVQGDVSLVRDAKKIAAAAMRHFKKIDILVNNAGIRTIVLCGTHKLPILDMRIRDWDRILAVNLRGPFLMTKAVLPAMVRQRSGSIINISSNAGYRPKPYKAAYTASKHGLEGFTKALAAEVKEFGVRANTLAPGGLTNVDGTGGLPVDTIVPACNYLASDTSVDVTGQSIIAKEWNKQNIV